ncbi:MAG: nuclear transport factor 2 family protein [Proteobacteria bacterium]|nr:nuclear transport factor 2 family protein [Pseudomonadota bacterium]
MTHPATKALFDRWEKVWHEARYDLVPACVADQYVRHDEAGSRTVTREAYAAEVAGIHMQRPGIRVLVYDRELGSGRAWFRFAFCWRDAASGKAMSRAGMQAYRIDGGKLAETWLAMQPMGSVWPDPAPLAHWTSERR